MIKRKTGKRGKNVQINFDNAFEEIKKKLYSDAADVISQGFEDVVRGTPVLTGYAKSNWRVLFGNAKATPAPPKQKEGPYDYRDEVTVILDGKSVIKILKKNGFGDKFRFYNPTPYMGMLENGHSSKNSFWIKASVNKMANKLSGMKKKGF